MKLNNLLLEEVEKGNISASNLHKVNKYVQSLYTAKLKSEGHVFKSRVEDKHTISVCKYILQGYSVKESINITTTELSPDYDILVAKNYRWYTRTNVKQLIRKIIDLYTSKKYGRYNTFLLSKVDTPSQLFNNLKKEYDMSKEIEHLNKTIDTLMDSKVDKKDMAVILYAQGGYTKKSLAEHLGVSLSTMKRWLSHKE